MLTSDHLKAIKRRVERASKGPWEVAGCGGVHMNGRRDWYVVVRGDLRTASFWTLEDAEFAAHARTDLPALVAEVERWWAFRDRLRILLLRWRCEADGMPGLLQHSAGEIEALLAEMGLAGTEDGGERDQGEGTASC